MSERVHPPFWLSPADSEKTALWDARGAYSYGQLATTSTALAQALLGALAIEDLAERRIGLLVHPSFEYVVSQWGVWKAGGVVVPLCTTHPLPELVYSTADSRATAIIYEDSFAQIVEDLRAQIPGVHFFNVRELAATTPSAFALPRVELNRRAQILYTSGTTGKPKGVMTTHDNLLAQVRVLVTEWGWSKQDHALLVLPLHHTHGIINVLCCALAAGASLEMLSRFDPGLVWSRFADGRDGALPTVFMAVPTIYSKLIEAHREFEPERQQLHSAAAAGLRLMVSGSAALPVSVLERWRDITGHVLLERYGMTEIGMALSNPLHGERRPGSVGKPLPGCEVRVEGGEIQVRGPSVFLEYFDRPKETAESFTEDGWFKTGDAGEISDDGYYRILGRNSVDILKTGGYKVSALEIEDELRAHPAVLDVAVVGLPDDEWGDRVAAAIVLRSDDELSRVEGWLRERLAPYKIPRIWMSLSSLPKNAMGKVVKQSLKQLFFERTKAKSSVE